MVPLQERKAETFQKIICGYKAQISAMIGIDQQL